MRKPLLAGAVALALMVPGYTLAASWSKSGSTATMTRSNRADVSSQNFLDKAWNINNFEIEAGREKLRRTRQTLRVLDYARRIVRDHTNMDDELKPIVQQDRLNVPNALDKEHQNLLQQLSSATGAHASKSASGHSKSTDTKRR